MYRDILTEDSKLTDWMDIVCEGKSNAVYAFRCDGSTEWVLQIKQNESGKWTSTAYEYRKFCTRFLNLSDINGAVAFDTEQECAITAFRRIFDICSTLERG